MPLPSSSLMRVLHALVAATLLAALPGCRSARVEAPAPAAAAGSRPMSWRVASAHLEDIFAEIPHSGIDDLRRDTPEAERLLVNAAHGEAGVRDNNAHVYGEPSPAATDQILKRLQLGTQDVLYDFGCGRGFFLMQALLTSPLPKAVGVELAASRLAMAQKARDLMQTQGLLGAGKKLELLEQDMTKAPLDDATVVFMDSVFFSDEVLLTMAQRMARAKHLRQVVMIMKGLPTNPWFEPEATERLKMSWSPRFGSDVLFFKRTEVSAD